LWLLFSLGIIVFNVSSFKLNHNALLIERDQGVDKLSIGMNAWSLNVVENYTMSNYTSIKQKIRAVRAF